MSRLSGVAWCCGAGLGVDETGDLSRFGEQLDAAEPAAMLDEGLDVIRSVWSGDAVAHHGRHYDVEVDESPPEPHPIPIWLPRELHRPHPGVLRRAGAG